MPQSTTAAQPSLTMPQADPSWTQLLGVHVPEPHWFGALPPQVKPTGQEPQSTVPPQVSGAMPQLASSCAHVLGLQSPPELPPVAEPLLPPTPLSPAGLGKAEVSSVVEAQDRRIAVPKERKAKDRFMLAGLPGGETGNKEKDSARPGGQQPLLER